VSFLTIHYSSTPTSVAEHEAAAEPERPQVSPQAELLEQAASHARNENPEGQPGGVGAFAQARADLLALIAARQSAGTFVVPILHSRLVPVQGEQHPLAPVGEG
jgi:hypothetical protein